MFKCSFVVPFCKGQLGRGDFVGAVGSSGMGAHEATFGVATPKAIPGTSSVCAAAEFTLAVHEVNLLHGFASWDLGVRVGVPLRAGVPLRDEDGLASGGLPLH